MPWGLTAMMNGPGDHLNREPLTVHISWLASKFQCAYNKSLLRESMNAGSISEIIIYDTKNKAHTLYANKTPKALFYPVRMFRHKFPLTLYKVKKLKLILNTQAVSGFNDIDAIAISSQKEDIKTKVNSVQYGKDIAEPQNLGPAVNSSYDERLPIISPNGKTLFFARKMDPRNVGTDDKDDIWVSHLMKDGTWSTAINAGGTLNTKEHNFVVASNITGDVLYLANDYKTESEGLSYSKKRNGQWAKPRVFQITDHVNRSKFVSYHLSVDGDVLLMSVHRDEGFGYRDFYVSFQKGNDVWTRPKSLGPIINTVGEENTVFLAADNTTIYFSSNGHYGYGGLDMFMSKRLDDSWTKWSPPKNMGEHINTPANDYNYTVPASGDYAYFASEFHTYGGSDLFRIRLPEESRPGPVKLITGRILHSDTRERVDVTLKPLEDDALAFDDSESTYTSIVRPGENHQPTIDIEGYYAVAEVVDESKEEVDIDPEMLQNEETLKELNIEKDPEVEALLNQLNSLQKEINVLKEEEVEIKKEAANDPELDALRQKYAVFNTSKEPRNRRTSRPENRDNLRPAYIPPDRPAKREEKVEETEEDEVAAMKRKFFALNNPGETYREESPEASEVEPESEVVDVQPASIVEETPTVLDSVNEEVENHVPITAEPPAPIEAPEIDFEAIEREVRQQLREEYKDQVLNELEGELASDVKNQLTSELEGDIRKKLRDSLYNTVEDELRTGLTSNVQDELKKDLKDDVEQDLRTEMQDDIRERIIAEEQARINNELRDSMKDALAEQLRRELSGPVKRELKRDMEYVIKKELEASIRKDLEEKIKAQLAEEYGLADASAPLKEYQEVNRDIFLVPIKVGQVIPLNNIFFDVREATLKEESQVELNRAVLFLEKNSNLIIEVSGHTNTMCSTGECFKLSRNRAKTVANYFIAAGVSENQINHKGYGKSHPVAFGKGSAVHKKNQRVELKILEILED